MRRNGSLRPTLAQGETALLSFARHFAIPRSVHHDTVSLWGFPPTISATACTVRFWLFRRGERHRRAGRPNRRGRGSQQQPEREEVCQEKRWYIQN